MHSKTPGPVTLSGSPHGDAHVGCEWRGARYHIWLSPTTLQPRDEVVYKNPPLGTERYHEGYFYTRKLTRTKGEGAVVAAHMLAAVPALEPAMRADIQRQVDEAAAAHAAVVRARKTHEAAPELVDMLRAALAFVELFTGNGAREQPPAWACNAHGETDPERIAKKSRELLAGLA
jgi:hypothetical protein